jgi:hypothetical protein
MYETHNPLDVDIGALKKGEIDLGTSMYSFSRGFADIRSMAVKFAGGVILGADSRTTVGIISSP